MKKKRTKSKAPVLYLLRDGVASTSEDDVVAGPGEERHSWFSRTEPHVVPATGSSIPEQWSKVIDGAVETVARAIGKSPLGFELSEVELSFGVGSDGLLGLLVGVKAEGAVKIKFTPPRTR